MDELIARLLSDLQSGLQPDYDCRKAAAALRASQAEIARLRKALLAAYAALDNGAEREDVKDDIHAALATHHQTS